MTERIILSHVFAKYRPWAFRVRLEWKAADLWIGAFWHAKHQWADRWEYDVWVCVLPCLPIHITWWKGLPR